MRPWRFHCARAVPLPSWASGSFFLGPRAGGLDLLRGSPVCLDTSLEQKTKTKKLREKQNCLGAGEGQTLDRACTPPTPHTHTGRCLAQLYLSVSPCPRLD